jgi:hypothetical protein
VTDQSPTALDLFRLGVLVERHGGELPCVPRGVADTYRRLAAAGLAELEDDTLEIPHGCDVHNIPVTSARITPEGQAVVDAMAGAGKATAAGIVLDIPDADVFRRLCQPKNAIDENTG